MSIARLSFSLMAAATATAGAALADVPRVATDIAPVHSLVARVMQGVGTPDLIVQPGASPHEYNLRPSEAAALQEADLVFWIGAGLTPWLEGALDTLARDAAVTALLESEGTRLLEFREGALFEAHDHGDHEDHAHDENHGNEHGQVEDRHEEHAEDEHGHDDHAGDDHGHEDHAHGAHDPHAWLSARNAATWMNTIAARLSAADPDNAGTYFANAAAARTEIAALVAEIDALLDPVRGGSFVVFHDAYQYFESDFDFPAAGAISLSDATDPSPARIAEIQARVADEAVDCVLAEPQFNAGIVAAVLNGTAAKTAVIDPLGAELSPGPMLYPEMLRGMARSLAGCL